MAAITKEDLLELKAFARGLMRKSDEILQKMEITETKGMKSKLEDRSAAAVAKMLKTMYKPRKK